MGSVVVGVGEKCEGGMWRMGDDVCAAVVLFFCNFCGALSCEGVWPHGPVGTGLKSELSMCTTSSCVSQARQGVMPGFVNCCGNCFVFTNHGRSPLTL